MIARGLAAAVAMSAAWVLVMRATGYHPFVADLVFALPALVAIAAGRGLRATTRVRWAAAAVVATALLHLGGVALDLRIWPATRIGNARLYQGIAYESLSWSVAPVITVLFVRRFPGAFESPRAHGSSRRS